MEVHHHPHVEKKSFKEYLLEGLMIFLAVSMGFIAENVRERISDSAKENEYMASLKEDLKNDIISIKATMEFKQTGLKRSDTLMSILRAGNTNTQTAELYYLARSLSIRNYFYTNDGTIQQLKNAGGFRMIRKRNVIDSLQKYISSIGSLYSLQDMEEAVITDYRKPLGKIFDAQVFNSMYDSTRPGLVIKKPGYNPTLLSADKFDLNEFAMKVVYIKGVRLAEMGNYESIAKRAARIIALIEKEYHLEKE